MSSYTWEDFPSHGTTNFELVARSALNTWKTNGQGMESRLNSLEDGTFYSTPVIPSAALIGVAVDKLPTGIPVTNLDVDGTVTEGAALINRSGNWIYEPIEGVVGGDSYTVKWSAAGSAVFMESFVASDAELMGNTANDKLVTPQGLKKGMITASVNNMSTVSGSITVNPTHGIHVMELIADTEITFAGMTDNTVHYSLMLIISNPSGYTLTWANTIVWPDATEPEITTGRVRLMISTYDGGNNYDASQVIQYAA